MISDLNKKLLTLHKLRGVGPATLQKLSLEKHFETASVSELAATNTKLDKALGAPGAWDNAVHAAEADLYSAERAGARIVSVLDEEYPELLRSTNDRPFFLYVKGQWSTSPTKAVAVIGTRHPTEHGAIVAKRISIYLAENGWSIVSGLAMGCDAIAHQAVIEVHGHTVAVLAHGLHMVAPKQNEKLAGLILDKGGALVSEYAFGVDPIPANFVKRDRIQAGLSRGVIMVQSDLKGGSLHASRAAIDYHRILAVPVPTERDKTNGEQKIEANLVLTSGTEEEKADILKCQLGDLDRLFAIRSKDDYETLAASFG